MKHPYLAKLWLFLFFAGFGLCSSAYAQTGSISGQVFDDKKVGIPGATVVVDGTTLGNSTNAEGAYSIQNVPAGPHTLVVSYVGYTGVRVPVTVVAGENVEANATLAESATQLSEAVVVGYGTQSRRQLTGAVSTVEAKAFENAALPSFDAGLQGRAAGVQVQQSNGVPGAAVRVRIRGQASVSASSDPLYVVDGIQLNNGDFGSRDGNVSAVSLNPLASINPSDIESVTILKDAAAGAIYGARAANGVVIIKTKRGKSGATAFNLDYSVGYQEPTNRLKMLNGAEYKQLFMEAYRNDSAATNGRIAFPSSINGVPTSKASFAKNTTDTNWYDEVFRKGTIQNVSLSASGGNEKTRFFVSGGYNRNEGMLRGNTFERASLRINVDNDATERLTIGTQTGLYYTVNNQVRTSYNGGLGAAQSVALPIFPVYNPDGSYFGTQFYANNNRSPTFINPTAQLDDEYTTTTLRTVTSVYFNYKIAKGLELRPQFGLDYSDQNERFYLSPTNRYYQGTATKASGLGTINERHVNFYNATTNTTLTYNRDLTENNHITAIVGTDLQLNTQRDIGIYTNSDGAGFTDPYFTLATENIGFSPNTTAETRKASPIAGYNSRDFYRFASVFGRVNYAYAGRYIAEVSLRSDGSSRFGPNNRFGLFPAVSAAWILSDENFLKENNTISLLKFRASLGRTGNAEIGNFNYLGLIGPVANAYMGLPGQAPTNIPNPDVTWESNRSYDLALDFGVLNSRITGTVAYYNKRGSDILLNQAVQVSASGISRLGGVNSGVIIQNQGWEAELTSRNLVGKFTWTSNLNLSANYNVVLSAGGIPPDGFETGGPGDARILEGFPVGTNYLAEYVGINPQNGFAQIRTLEGAVVDLDPSDRNAANLVQNNRKGSGHPFPKVQGGFDNTFTFAGFDLDVFLVGSYGNIIYDDGAKYQNGGNLFFNGADNFKMSWNQTARLLDRWQKPGDQADYPKLTLTAFDPNKNNTTQWLYDGSYLRLRTLSLGYTLPTSLVNKMHVSRLRVYVTGTNLALFTKFPGWDPEVVRYANGSGQVDRNNGANIAFSAPYLPTPQARTITAGFTLGF